MAASSNKFSLSIGRKSRCDIENDRENGEDPKVRDSDPTTSAKQHEGCLVVSITSEVTQIGKNVSVIFNNNEISQSNDYMMLGSTEERDTGQNRNEDKSTDESSEGLRFIANTKRKKRKKMKPSQCTDLAVHKNLQPAEPPESLLELYQISNDVMTQVQKLRDNGRWDLFEETAVTLSRKYTSFDAQIILLLERAMAACYSNRLEEARKMIKSGIKMANDTENSGVLVGRGLYYLSAVYRRENKTGKAVDCVTMAEQSFSNYGVVTDRCSLTYEQASALMDFILQCPQPKPALLEKVMSSLKRSIDECLILLDSDKPNLYVKTHHYAFMKMAMLLLDCRNSAGRKRIVKRENVEEAERLLAILKTRYWHKMSLGEQIQYYFGQADLNFRKAQFQSAEKFVLKAFEMAEIYKFNTEIRLAQERLDDIRLSWYQHDLVFKSRDIRSDQSVPSSEGHVTDVSASSDSDWLIQAPLS